MKLTEKQIDLLNRRKVQPMKNQIKKLVVAEISAFPIGKEESLSKSVAEVVKVIKESGLK